jgi:glutamine cyclotransferase
MIDLRTGIVVAQWDMAYLLEKQIKHINNSEGNYYLGNAVLNGIAYYEKNDSFLISGKMWDFIYEIKFDYN